MVRWFFKWLFRLMFAVVTLAVILVVALLLSYNSILRTMLEHQIREQTGMDAEIGRLRVAIFAPTVELQNVKIYNPAKFGGTPFLNIPEIHIEYDREALARHELHITLMRLNLGELDIVKNQAGQTNIFAFGLKLPAKKSGTTNAFNFKKQTGYSFDDIDTLNVSIGKLKFIDLGNPRNNREQTIGIENCIVPHVKSAKDLSGLMVLIDLRSNHFFDSILGVKPGRSDAVKGVLDVLGIPF